MQYANQNNFQQKTDLLKKEKIEITDFFIGSQLNQALISDFGEKNVLELGKLLCESVDDFINGKKKSVSKELNSNQLRKFYDSFIRIYDAKIPEDQKKIQLLMLKANSEYSANRLTIKRFEIFLNNRINLVIKKTGEDFKRYMDALKLHFEALVAYYPKKD